MAVGNVEIAVGQVWRCRDGEERTVQESRGNKQFCWALDDGTTVTSRGMWDGAGENPKDLIELVRDEHGFTPWAGGECPLKPGQYADIRYRGGNDSDHVSANSDLRWTHIGTHGDIVAYKLADTGAETLVNDIMVNSVLQDGIREAMEKPDSASLAEETLSALGWVFDGTTWVERPRIEMIEGGVPTMAVPGYELLADVLHRAFNQAAIGKGKERHANGEPFDEQVMQDGARRFGVGALLFQAFKKSEESQRLPLERGVNELLGAIVYLAGAVIRREADASEGGAA